MTYGDIVLLRFPFSDNQSVKRRPALVIWNSQDDDDVLVSRITSQLYKSKMDVVVENWEAVGLMLPSTIRVHKMACIEKRLVEKKIGYLDELHKTKVLKAFEHLIQNMTVK